jgi:hypothetical protein
MVFAPFNFFFLYFFKNLSNTSERPFEKGSDCTHFYPERPTRKKANRVTAKNAGNFEMIRQKFRPALEP